MKRFLMLFATAFVFGISLMSCSIDNDPKVNFNIDFVAADSVLVPQYFRRGQTYDISVYYKKPNDCYYDDGFYAERNGNEITVAVQNIVLENTNCNPVQSTVSNIATFRFQCPLEQTENYTFKFYKGDDVSGQQQFIEKVVPAGP